MSRQGRSFHLRPRHPGRARVRSGGKTVAGRRTTVDGKRKARDWICRPSSVIRCLSCRRANRSNSMAKKVTGYLKLQVPAGAANPSPPIGPALGQRGLNIMEFCKAFNAQTQKEEKNTPIPVVITTYQDRSFTFELKTPPVSYFIKKAAN